MTVQIFRWVVRKLLRWGVAHDDVELVAAVSILVAVLLIAVLVQRLGKNFLAGSVRALARRTEARWDDMLAERHVLEPLSHLGAGMVMFTLLPIAFVGVEDAKDLIRRGALAYMVVITALVVERFLTALVDLYQELDHKHTRPPVKSYAQVFKITNFIVAGILLVSIVLGQSPLVLLGGLGALSAVLLLVFKDPLLGLVASVQLNANDMIRRGDPIEVPKYGVEGEVVDMSLTIVKVLSADRSIATVPNYALVNESFRNMRNISEAGVRRVKRGLSLDVHSVRFLDAADIEALARHTHVAAVLPQLADNFRPGSATNLGVFRRYVEARAAAEPRVAEGMPLFVRQVPPSENGVGLELNGYVRENNYVAFEALQAELFEHFIAVAGVFGLRLFQGPSSHVQPVAADSDESAGE
jgi:miniconductance mechanosensitive channel